MIRFIKNNWIPIAAVIFNMVAAINIICQNINAVGNWLCFFYGICFSVNLSFLVYCLFAFIKNLRRHKNEIYLHYDNSCQFNPNNILKLFDEVRIIGGPLLLREGNIFVIDVDAQTATIFMSDTLKYENVSLKYLFKI